MSYMNIGAGAFIDYLGGRWRYERRQGHKVEWRQSNTFEHATLTDREIGTLIRKGELRLYNGDGRKPQEGKTSIVHGQRGPSKADWEEAGRKLLFVQAIHEAGLFVPGASVDDWETVIQDVWQREGSGWTMLRGKNKGRPVGCPVYKSVRRWTVHGGKRPTLEKMLNGHRFKGRYEDRLHPELRAFIAERVQRDYLQRPAITTDALKTIIDLELKDDLNARRKAAGQKPFDPPGLKAIQSSIDAVPKDEVLRRRYGEMAAFLAYGSAEAQQDPIAPLDRVELDSTPVDLFVVDPDSGMPIGRATLVVAIDRCTRMVLGWFVTFEKPSIHALMQCLRNAILPKDYLEEVKKEQGWAIVNDCETFGVPRTLVLDRGRENLAEHVARFAVRAGISRVEITGGKKPWLKGAVERVLKTISERVFHPTPGTTFHDVLMKMDYDPQKDAVCTPADLDYGLHKFFIDIYPFEQRRSLNNAQSIKVWRKLTRKYPVDSIGAIEQVAHLFGRTEFCIPGRHGINYESLQFFSPELLEAQTSAQFQKALRDQGGKIEFHVNPGDLGMIQVRLPHRDKVIDVPVAPKWRRYATGLSIWHHRCIRRFAAVEAQGDAEMLLQAKYDLMQIMKGQGLAKRGGLRARGMSARMDGLLRFARAGDDARTDAEPHPVEALREGSPDASEGAAEDQVGTAPQDAANDAGVTRSSPDAIAIGTTPTDNETSTTAITGQAVRRRARKGYRP
jgi:putative transposase